MKRARSRAAVLAVAMATAACGSTMVDSSSHPDGGIEITPFTGASVQLEFAGTVIHVDPSSLGDYSQAKPADLILITDTPDHHLDPALVSQLRLPGAPVVVPLHPHEAKDEGGRDRLLQVPDPTVMRNGETRVLAGVTVEAVPMYDIIPGNPFHAKGEANGYVITLGERRVYIAGVTECVPEIQDLPDIDIAFMPLNLPHGRMTPIVAAECVKRIGPRVVYPFHYREIPIDDFVEHLRDEPIEVRLHEWYPWAGL